MKKRQIVAVVAVIALIAVVFLSAGTASALQSSDASTSASLSNQTPKAGNTITVSVTIQSKTTEEMQILRIGFHGDWMAADSFQGPNLMSDPPTVQGNGVYTTQFMVTIPTNTNIGPHEYYIAVDAGDSTGQSFALDSAKSTMQVLSASSGTSTPTGNPDNGGQTDSSQNWLFYGAVIAVVAIVVVLVVIVLTRRKRGHPSPAPAAKPAENPPPSKPPENPDQGQDFDI